jgi:hypothetical protein
MHICIYDFLATVENTVDVMIEETASVGVYMYDDDDDNDDEHPDLLDLRYIL